MGRPSPFGPLTSAQNDGPLVRSQTANQTLGRTYALDLGLGFYLFLTVTHERVEKRPRTRTAPSFVSRARLVLLPLLEVPHL